MNSRFVVILLSLCVLTSLFSCLGTAPTKEVKVIDSLNLGAYSYRYKNLDTSFELAKKAYDESSLYASGKAEACNNLGFCAYMQMNFEQAESLYKEVYTLTQNELELLIADVGLMKIYQRTAMNKEFYDCRNRAIARMKRIDEDRNLFVDEHEVIRLNFAYSDFFIVSAVYYYHLRQIPEAIASLNQIRQEELQGDTSQLLYFTYMKGSAGLFDNMVPEEKRLNEFDYLYYTWQHASRGGYTYFEGSSLQGLANLMIFPTDLDYLVEERAYRFTQFNLPPDDLLPLKLAQKALNKFHEYNDIYQISETYVTIGKYLNIHGHYAEALDSLGIALDYVNLYNRLYYPSDDDNDEILEVYVKKDTIQKEISWITGQEIQQTSVTKIKAVPEWISRIREQLSVSYAGLGMKPQSDYNRNIYLDILNYTRQDKESESRYVALQQESKLLNMILLGVVVGILFVILLFWLFNKRTRKRNQIYISRLRLTLDICQKITSAISTDIHEEKEIIAAIINSVLPDMRKLFHVTDMHIYLSSEHKIEEEGYSLYRLMVPDKREPIGLLAVRMQKKLSKDDQALLQVIAPYIAWTIDNGITFLTLGDERENLEKQKYVFEQHIARNKRENLIKKACLAIVNGIIPYMDRIINEVYKLKEKGFIHHKQIKKEKYQYIDELVTTINEYNDILALWIKMKQGSLSLNIENFALNDLFSLVLKGRKTFEMKKQTFQVTPTDTIVKADKALTLFMINTLTENARKYTPEGGTIKIYAQTTEEYVEISIEDNGRGLAEEDVALIEGEKIYNSQLIGLKNEEAGKELKQLKGSGFGLMNCKGIIEKYKKTNQIFKVCTFGVDSELGRGSRFFFRLPLGIRKTLTVLICMLLPFGSAYSQRTTEYERLLDEASAFADTANFCNVIAQYELALQYVDSAIHRLNLHHEKCYPSDKNYMELIGNGIPSEVIWWNQMYESEFTVILYMRNEAAISFLALKQLEGYTYNNEAHEFLFKLYSEDPSWEAYSFELERSTINKKVGLGLCVLLLISSFFGYYFLYMRRQLTNRWNLEQVLEINKKIFASSHVRSEESMEALQREENTLKEIPQKIVYESFKSVNELIEIDRLAIVVYNESSHRLEIASKPELNAVPDIVRQSFRQKQIISNRNLQAFPLIVEVGENNRCVGVLYLERREGRGREVDSLLLELVTRYIAVVIFNAVIKLAMRYRDIESAYEETHRASWEDSMLHVQNMVLDNCLSTIKHETIYYPNKIKQIIGKLNSEALSDEEENSSIDDISELIEYYKGIFTILSSCASRQLEEVTFRRTTIKVSDLLQYAVKYFKKVQRSNREKVTLIIDAEPSDFNVIGDLNQLYFLFENLINEVISVQLPGVIRLQAVIDGDFIRFLFTDERREKQIEELNHLFYPNLARMTSGDKGELKGTEYLVCKQIIRDHDEFAGRRGCRINAEPALGGGFTVYFTIPKR